MTNNPLDIDLLVGRHLRFGWWTLLLFLTMGIALEAMHGFKLGMYMDVDNHTRRLMWTLAHAHGTLLSVIQIVFAVTLSTIRPPDAGRLRTASLCLMGAGILIPAGFFLGGVIFYAGDPGLGILLLPIGALLLFTAVLLTARQIPGVQDASNVATNEEVTRGKRKSKRR